MCETTTVMYIALALSAAGTAASYEGQRKQASQTADNLNKENALESNDLQRQQDQIDAAARQQMNANQRKALADLALFDVVAGEYGGGKSVDRTRTIGVNQANENLSTIAENRSNAVVENGFQGLAQTLGTQAKLSSIQQPSLFASGLKLAGDGLNAYTGYQDRTARLKPSTK